MFMFWIVLAALAGWGFAVTNNIFILLAAMWLLGLAIMSSMVTRRVRLNALGVPRSGRRAALPEQNVVVLLIGLSSFIAFFIVQPHWFLLLHGAIWSFIAAGGLLRWYSKSAW